eukprot:XP_011671138.1 PREDICTED: uncharacterized protein LOC105441590 [Strongylocentrotus purpuratus]
MLQNIQSEITLFDPLPSLVNEKQMSAVADSKEATWDKIRREVGIYRMIHSPEFMHAGLVNSLSSVKWRQSDELKRKWIAQSIADAIRGRGGDSDVPQDLLDALVIDADDDGAVRKKVDAQNSMTSTLSRDEGRSVMTGKNASNSTGPRVLDEGKNIYLGTDAKKLTHPTPAEVLSYDSGQLNSTRKLINKKSGGNNELKAGSQEDNDRPGKDVDLSIDHGNDLVKVNSGIKKRDLKDHETVETDLVRRHYRKDAASLHVNQNPKTGRNVSEEDLSLRRGDSKEIVKTIKNSLELDINHKRDNEHHGTKANDSVAEADSVRQHETILNRNSEHRTEDKSEKTKGDASEHLEIVKAFDNASHSQEKSEKEVNLKVDKGGGGEIQVIQIEDPGPKDADTEDQEETKPLIVQIGWKRFIDPHQYPYIMNPADACSSWSQESNITLLILVLSSPSNFVRRDTIRRTWMATASSRNLSTKTLFLLGATKNKGLQMFITQEAERWHDIIQEDFVDSYFNLTIKTVMGLKWASKFCLNAAFVMKSDDDIMLNIVNLTADLNNAPMAARRNFVTGRKISGVRPIREVDSKWYTPESMFSDEKYPAYPEGHAYIMSADVAKMLYRVSTTVPIFPWEDVFVGMCLQEIGLEIYYLYAVNLNGCLHSSMNIREDKFLKTSNTLLALQQGYFAYDLTPEEMEFAWSALDSRKWPYTEKGFCSDNAILRWNRLPDIWKGMINS